MYEQYFNLNKNIIYLNAASSGILTVNAKRKIDEYIEYITSNGDINVNNYINTINQLNNNIAKLINANTENIGIIRNTTEGVLIVKNSFSDMHNIIIYGKSFPCTSVPFMYDKKYRMEIISQDVGLFKKIIKKSKSTIVFIDYVHFLTGRKSEIEEIIKIAKKYNAIIAVDAIQAIGSLPIDVKKLDIDFLFAGSSKWMLGPKGSGFIFIKDKFIKQVRNKYLGWLSLDYKDFGDFENLPEPRNDASVVQNGTLNFIGIIGLNENIKTILNIGIENIYKYNMKNILMILKQLDTMGSVSQNYTDIKTPIVALKCKNTKKLYAYLYKNNVIVSYRDGYIRFAPHIYNSKNDIEDVIDILKKYKV